MGRRRIEVKDFVRDVRAGTSDSDLRKKYGLSQKILDEMFSRLVKSGQLHPSDLMRDVSQAFESTLVVATTCQRCGALLWADSGECSNCLANRDAQLLEDEERARVEAAAKPAQIPEIEVADRTDAVQEVESSDSTPPDDEFSIDDVVEIEAQEPEDVVIELDEQDVAPEPQQHESKPRRWLAIAAMIFFAVATPLAVLLYTEVLELPEIIRPKPPVTPIAEKPKPRVAQQHAAAVAPVGKEPESARAPMTTRESPDPGTKVAAKEKPAEPQHKAEKSIAQQPVEGTGSEALSPIQQSGAPSGKVSPDEAPREPIPTPQAVPDVDHRTLPEPAAPGRTAAAVPPPEPGETTGAPLSSTEPAGKREEAPVSKAGFNTALMTAVNEGPIDRVMLLLDRGADVNAVDAEGSPLLLIAAKRGNESLVDLLLERGADRSLRDKQGLTALARSCEAGNGRIVELLLKHDKLRGAADLLDACEKGRTKCAKLLLDRGADVNARDNDGGTPLMIAAGKGQLELVEALLAKGADTTAQDNKGFTALAWAYSPTAMNVTPFRVQREIIRLLKHYGSAQATVPQGDRAGNGR